MVFIVIYSSYGLFSGRPVTTELLFTVSLIFLILDLIRKKMHVGTSPKQLRDSDGYIFTRHLYVGLFSGTFYQSILHLLNKDESISSTQSLTDPSIQPSSIHHPFTAHHSYIHSFSHSLNTSVND